MKMTDSKMKKIFSDNYHGNEESLQETIRLLKQAGYSQMESLKFLMHELNLTIKEADLIMINARAWSSEKENNLKARDELGMQLD